MAPLFRRKNYFTKKGYQTRFVIPFLLASTLANVITVTLFIFTARYKINSLLFSMRLPQAEAGALLSPIALAAGMAAVVIVVALFLWASRSTYHKMERPLSLIRDDLREIQQGDLGCKVILRESDEFKDFAGEINSMVGELNRRIAGLKNGAAGLANAADMLGKTKPADPRAIRRDMSRQIRLLEEQIGAFHL